MPGFAEILHRMENGSAVHLWMLREQDIILLGVSDVS